MEQEILSQIVVKLNAIKLICGYALSGQSIPITAFFFINISPGTFHLGHEIPLNKVQLSYLPFKTQNSKDISLNHYQESKSTSKNLGAFN